MPDQTVPPADMVELSHLYAATGDAVLATGASGEAAHGAGLMAVYRRGIARGLAVKKEADGG